MSGEVGNAALLPEERLIAERRNGVVAAELEAAPTLRLAAAEIVREGYLLHYGQARWYEIDDLDLSLLAGDRMYASGLAALAEAGDVEAVRILAELIADCAEAHAICAEAHAIDEGARTDALWQAALAMLARGSE